MCFTPSSWKAEGEYCGKRDVFFRKIDFFFSSIDTSPEGVELYNSCWVFLGNKIT